MNLGKKNRYQEHSTTLAAQIKATEIRLFNRQRRAHLHTNMLLKDLQKEMTSPTTLLLIGELGFVLGELTKPSPKNKRQPAQPVQAGTGGPSPDVEDVAPLKKLLDLGSSMMTMYQILPLAWLMETFHPQYKSTAAKANNPTPPPSSV